MGTSGTVFDKGSVVGSVANPNSVAVSGINSGAKADGFIAGPEPIFHSPVGVFGRSDNVGVFGFANTAKGTGVAGNSAFGNGNGVHGHTSFGIGVLGSSDNKGLAGKFIGDVEVTGDICLLNQDVAEDFDMEEGTHIEPGQVMVFDLDGKLGPCRHSYDRKVAGVIAGAGDFKPGIVLGKLPSAGRRLPVALVGKVYCKVDAEYGEVEVGDLLTTSPTLGHAMKAEDPSKAFGAVIGKALRPLGSGQGLIPILIALQ